MPPSRSLSVATSKSSLWRYWNVNTTGIRENAYEAPREPPSLESLYQDSWPLRPEPCQDTGQVRMLRVADLETDSLQQPPDNCMEVSSLDGYDAESARAFNGDYQGDSGDEGGSEPPDDPNLVTWCGKDDPDNPHNWPRHKKWSSTLLVSCFTFISPVSSTMLAPALPTLGEEFNTSSGIERYLIMSIFLLAYAVGPFILAPLSEMYGRVVVLQAANMVFLIFNTVCGFSQTKAQILAFRFLSGLGGAAPQALGGGVLSDCWRAEERGSATAVYSLAPFLGPAIGPIAGGYLVQYMNWRWIFWVVSIADAVVQILAFLFLPETYPPKILATRAKKLRKSSGNKDLHTEYDRPDRSFIKILLNNLERPFVMLFTQPTIQLTGLYRAYLYGLMYLVLASFPMVWEEQYDQEPGRASLNYLSLGVGFVIGLQVSGPMIDKVYKKLKAHYNHPGRPEFRVPLMFPTAIIAPGGLLLYGISAHFKTHWIVPNIGAAIFAGGLILSFQCAQTYVVDSYERYAASATGAAAFIRTMAGFSFPLFAPGLYKAVGVAVGNGILAGIAFVICLAAPAIMWKYGERIRARSQYCAG
ncbi:unnamed protein product [Clonostachys rosea]|uniref:Major facilitator superfamily (MFS) profile domain-containing protein n=1 Tax=Bionectria ochroleuca TaxID=29856 RepID=A0ABY6UC95_BIOOC|nr:unnamed protein product [Clonostachys rosea]